MKTLRIQSLVLVLAVASLSMQGCSTILPGHNAVVVRAEQTIAIGADAFDTFLKSEYQTHTAFCAVSPTGCAEAHNFAEMLRTKVSNGTDAAGNPIMSRQYKKWLQSAAKLKEVYQGDPSSANRDELQRVLDTITAAVAEAQKYLVRLRAVKGP